MKRQVMSLLLALALCLSMLPAAALAAEEPEPRSALTAGATPPEIPTEGDVWDGVTITQPSRIVKKDGVNYYEISTCAELAYVAQTGGDWLSRNYLLANNLILNDVVLEWDEEGNLLNDPTTLHEWTPIGKDTSFAGIFDGNMKAISGLFINSKKVYACGLFGDANSFNTVISNIVLVNSYISAPGCTCVGGIAGYMNSSIVSNCDVDAFVIGRDECGGIVGLCNKVLNCVFRGKTIGREMVGGITGHGYTIKNCVNYGEIVGKSAVGGIAGTCYSGIDNSYNTGSISGSSSIGGIIGKNCTGYSIKLLDCYSIGKMSSSGVSSVGTVIGSDGAVFNRDSITGCYYLKTDEINYDLYGCGGVSSPDMEPEGFCARNEAAMKQQSTYEGWDFANTWCIDPARNGGYPYLSWQDVTDIPLTSLSLHQTALSLGVGDTVYLTATPSPMNADISELTWSSSDNSIVQVSQNGRITAVAPGSATITASCGGVSASCTVTVTPRASDEYALGTLVVRDESGTELSAIPRGNSLVTIPITKQSDGGSALVLLAAYGADGQYQGLLYVRVKNVPLGATVEITLPLDNASGKIARLKAFPVASFDNLTPLGAASEFPQS